MSHSLSSESKISLTIESLAFGGMGIGHLPDGKAVFVEKTAPGDEGSVRITKQKKRHAFAVMEHVEKPSPLRVSPRCPVADRCGGCSWAHLDLEAQRDWKQRLLIHEMARKTHNLDTSLVQPLVGAESFGHRIRCRLHRKARDFGTLESQSHRVIPFRVCPVLDPRLEEFAQALAKKLAPLPPIDADFELVVDCEGRRGLHIMPKRGRFPESMENLAKSLDISA